MTVPPDDTTDCHGLGVPAGSLCLGTQVITVFFPFFSPKTQKLSDIAKLQIQTCKIILETFKAVNIEDSPDSPVK